MYRPITVPSNIMRLLTVRMCDKMSGVIEANGLLGHHQFGFRKSRSTIDSVFLLNTLQGEENDKIWDKGLIELEQSNSNRIIEIYKFQTLLKRG